MLFKPNREEKLYDINEEENRLVIHRQSSPVQPRNVLYIKEKRYREYLIGIGFHLGLVLLLLLVTYLDKDINGVYSYQNQLEKLFNLKILEKPRIHGDNKNDVEVEGSSPQNHHWRSLNVEEVVFEVLLIFNGLGIFFNEYTPLKN